MRFPQGLGLNKRLPGYEPKKNFNHFSPIPGIYGFFDISTLIQKRANLSTFWSEFIPFFMQDEKDNQRETVRDRRDPGRGRSREDQVLPC